MSVETLSALTLSRMIAADPQRVWDAWTQPEQMKQWACPDPTAPVEVDVDLQVGGSYRLRMDIEGGPFTAHGVYREVDPPRRLVYTWDWVEESHQVGETLVTVEFVEVDGGTEVRLTHDGFPGRDATEAHQQGWSGCMDRFESVFA